MSYECNSKLLNLKSLNPTSVNFNNGTASLISSMDIHCKKERVAVTQLGLSELHNNVHTSISILVHYISPILDRRYTIKLGHVLQVGDYRNVRSEAAFITFLWLFLRIVISAAALLAFLNGSYL